jgi:Mrp family chromosome partitioning ATPase/capsular polysaccharide biosynthesis protein
LTDHPEAPRLDAVPDWVAGAPDSEGLPYYLTVLRSHIRFLGVLVAVCVGVAMLYLTQVEKVYESHADLLITPVPRDNETPIGLGLTRESTDPTRDVETIARLIETQAVARRVVRSLGLEVSPRQLLEKVDARPVASSNVVSIGARANDPELAAQIANAFGTASVAYRTDRMHDQLDVVIPQLRQQIGQLGSDEQAARDALLTRLRDLEALRGLNDPTLQLETRAEPSSDPVAPRRILSIAAAVLAGLIVGGATVFVAELLDRRLRREEQLRRYRIPVLARVPLAGSLSGHQEKSPLLSAVRFPAIHDSYRVLGAKLSLNRSGGRGSESGTGNAEEEHEEEQEVGRRPRGPDGRFLPRLEAPHGVDGEGVFRPGDGAKRSVLVTGPSPGDGKTTAALNLATVIPGSVVLVEADSRHPILGRVLGLSPKYGVSDVVARRIPLPKALVCVESQAPGVQLLGQLAGQASRSAVMTPAGADWLIRQTHLLADWLIVDAPPLTIVPDALSLAKQVDDVLLVVRLGNTRLKALEELAELLVQQGITPAGFVLVGVRPGAVSVPSRVERPASRSKSPPMATKQKPERAGRAVNHVSRAVNHVIHPQSDSAVRRSSVTLKRALSLLRPSRSP